MFPLVQILHNKGFFITGSDNNKTETTKNIEKMGIKIYYEQNANNIEGADLIIYTNAVLSDNKELLAARKSKVKLIERASLLGYISKMKNNVVCVSGTHGKTTTSCIISNIMSKMNFNPTYIIGGKDKKLTNPPKLTESENMVLEACEFNNSFLHLHPDIAIVLNIDEDHLDYFKSLDNIIKAFNEFCKKVSKKIIINGDCANSLKAVEGIDKKIVTFGFDKKNDYYVDNVIYNKNGFFSSYDIYHKNMFITNIDLSIAGRHNILNSLAAFISCYEGNEDKIEDIKKAIKEFNGVKRRLDVLGMINGATIIDDYAHHPKEIEATLSTIKQMNFKRIIAIHQPFTFSRTHIFLKEFSNALSIADEVILSPIMGSREKNNYGIKSEDLQILIDNCKVFDTFEDISKYVKSIAKEGDVFVTLGCGDIDKVSKMILNI